MKTDNPMVPVVINGETVGEISLATEYRILLQGMILGAEADLAHTKDRLAELDRMLDDQQS